MIGNTTTGLERELNVIKNRNGLTLGSLKLMEAIDAKEPIEARINPVDWGIEIILQQDYEPVRDDETREYCRIKKIDNPVKKICTDLLFHETGHWELPRTSGNGCPYDVPNHDLIVEAISEELKKIGKESYAGYAANAFEDIFDNTNCRKSTDHSGQILFWNEQGMTHSDVIAGDRPEENKTKPEKGYTKFYEAFVRLNLCIWGDVIDNQLLKRWYSTEDETRKKLQETIKQTLSEWQMPKYHLPRNNLAINGKVRHLFNKTTWQERARQFAKITGPLLDEPQTQSFFGNATSSPDKGTGKNSGTSAGKPKQSNYDKKLSTKEGKEEAAHSRYNKGDTTATNRDSYEQYDSLYRRIARNIPIESETICQAHTNPLVPIGREEFDPEIHDPATHNLRLGLSQTGEVILQINREWIYSHDLYKKNPRKFPKCILLRVDTSGSMKHAPKCAMTEGAECDKAGSRKFLPWGDNSKLHYAYLGEYGIENFLQKQHIMPFIDPIVLFNVSDSDIVSKGEGNPKNLLTPQFGGTKIDLEALRKYAQEGAVIISISDGEFQDWKTDKNGYKQIITAPGIQAAHIQIGTPNEFSRDNENWGIPVTYVAGDNDLAAAMIKTAHSQYKQYWEELQ